MTEGDSLHAEQRARVLIDQQLRAAGWHVCDLAQIDLIHHPNCAVREVIMKRGSGRVDYLIYGDRRIIGVIEAKPEGTTCRVSSGNRRCTPTGCRRNSNSRPSRSRTGCLLCSRPPARKRTSPTVTTRSLEHGRSSTSRSRKLSQGHPRVKDEPSRSDLAGQDPPDASVE